MTRKLPDRASHAEIIAIHRRLEQTTTKLDGGMCAYQDGVSDNTIAADLGVSTASVARIRMSMFGRVRAPVQTGVPVVAEDPRIDDLIKVTQNILKQYYDLRDRHNKLIIQLSIQRITDCRNLSQPA